MSQAQITQMDEYKSQIIEVEQLIGARMDQSEQKKKWDY